jgi:hypothetical protein
MKTLNKLTDNEKKLLKSGIIEVSGKAMNRTALGIVAAVFKLYPNITFSELKEILPDDINPSAPKNFKSIFNPFSERLYGVVQPFSIKTEIEKAGYDVSSTHFIENDEIFTTSDGVKIIVSKLWESKDTQTGKNDLQTLINHIEKYGIRVVDFEKYKGFSKGKYHIEVIQPELFSKLSDKKSSKLKYLLLLIIILIASYYLLETIKNN